MYAIVNMLLALAPHVLVLQWDGSFLAIRTFVRSTGPPSLPDSVANGRKSALADEPAGQSFPSIRRVFRLVSPSRRLKTFGRVFLAPGLDHLDHLDHPAPPHLDHLDHLDHPASAVRRMVEMGAALQSCRSCVSCAPALKGRRIGSPPPSQPSRPSRAPLIGWLRWGPWRPEEACHTMPAMHHRPALNAAVINLFANSSWPLLLATP